ncbi:hypothetical protein AVEN_232467-1 [Araneus ventricosus]|uniref:Uncharacterized protein n=1 Tax=Araneus ventricosus TaxID=182803 RepID=A0A4Y2E834_ARAVE|nr:hypothetical protein AVEN_232467-1 [Araneus ventricosus]
MGAWEVALREEGGRNILYGRRFIWGRQSSGINTMCLRARQVPGVPIPSLSLATPARCGGLVVRSRLRGRRVSGSKPDSTEDPPLKWTGCTLNHTYSVKCSAVSVVQKFGDGLPTQGSSSLEVRPKVAFKLQLLQNGTLI